MFRQTCTSCGDTLTVRMYVNGTHSPHGAGTETALCVRCWMAKTGVRAVGTHNTPNTPNALHTPLIPATRVA